MSKVPLFGISFDDIGMADAVEAALQLINSGAAAYAVTPNPEIVLAARRDPALCGALRSARLVLPDGVGLVIASRLLGIPLKHRLPGVDFALVLMERLSHISGSAYLLGAEPGVAEAAAGKLAARFPGLRIAGYHHGFFSAEEETAILGELRQSAPDLILVCLGSPRQELWMELAAPLLGRGLMVGLGGALDVYSGKKKRAPAAWRRLGLEWLFRLLQEPRRIRRVAGLPGILTAALKEKGRNRDEQRKTDRP